MNFILARKFLESANIIAKQPAKTDVNHIHDIIEGLNAVLSEVDMRVKLVPLEKPILDFGTRAHLPEPKACQACGLPFMPRGSLNKHCSAECYEEMDRLAMIYNDREFEK